ncbi:MAG TPA: hypothetical protein PKM21_11935 [Anaerolineales bacterium]|nr:hypothetical protein [Anaerolineales bacterium]
MKNRVLAWEEVVLGALEGLEIDSYLQAGGASPADLAAVRRRLLE